jgi:hypothetical protein
MFQRVATAQSYACIPVRALSMAAYCYTEDQVQMVCLAGEMSDSDSMRRLHDVGAMSCHQHHFKRLDQLKLQLELK